jgi:hypothetical protein
MKQKKNQRLSILVFICIALALLALTGCDSESEGGEDSALANDPLVPTAAAGEEDDTSVEEEDDTGGLGETMLTDEDPVTEDSAVGGGNTAVDSETAGGETTTGGETGTGGETAASGETAAGDATNAQGNLPSVAFDESFMDEGIATGTTTQYIQAAETTSDTPYWEVLPAYTEVRFDEYAMSDTQHVPRIYVYPVEEFESANETASGYINQLRQLLAERPETLAEDEALPFLPLFNAAQVMHAGVEYLNFDGGSGIRYLTQHDQAVQPINNNQLVYTFQGLTEDEQYYVAAVFPVSHPDLPADAFTGSEGSSAIQEDFEGYLADTVQQLNEADPNSFTPGLNILDSLIQSISVDSE